MAGSKPFDVAHDFPPMSQPSSKPILTFDRENPVKFTDLIDTLNSYVGYGGYFLMVTLTEDGVTVSPIEIESDKTYIHVQSAPAVEWSVKHDLEKYPSVQVVNSAKRVITGEVQYTDLNNLVVRFELSLSGSVYCN